jgi:O-antigen/teichoic acid export membrane protein
MSARTNALRNTAFSSVGIYTEFFLGMVASILIARSLGPHDFGAYSVVVWFVAMGVTVTNSGTAGAAIRFVAELRGSGRTDLIRPLLAYLRRAQRVFLLAVLVVGGLAFLLAGEHFAPGFNHAVLFGLVALGVAMKAPYMFNVGVAKGFENFRATATIAATVTPLNLLLILLAWWLHAPVEGFLLVFAVSSAAFYLVSRSQVKPLIPQTGDAVLPEDLLRRARRHMLFAAVTVSVTFITASDVEVLILNVLATSADAGHFKVAHLLSSGAATLVPGVFGALLLPMMAGALSQGQAEASRRFVASTSYLALLAAPLIALGALFAPTVVAVLYGSKFIDSGPALALLLVAQSITAISTSASSLLISADRQHRVLMLVAFCGALKIGLDIVLITRWGLTGATVAATTAAVVLALSMFAFAMRMLHTGLEWGRLARIALAALLATACALPLVRLESHWVALLGAALAALALYPLLTLVLGCWNRRDVEHLQNLHARLARGRIGPVGSLLAWAGERAPREGA